MIILKIVDISIFMIGVKEGSYKVDIENYIVKLYGNVVESV